MVNESLSKFNDPSFQEQLEVIAQQTGMDKAQIQELSETILDHYNRGCINPLISNNSAEILEQIDSLNTWTTRIVKFGVPLLVFAFTGLALETDVLPILNSISPEAKFITAVVMGAVTFFVFKQIDNRKQELEKSLLDVRKYDVLES